MSRQTRRLFLRNIGFGAASLGICSIIPGCSKSRKRPNIVLVITDDQGYADLGCHGNKDINTPNLDKFARESIELSQFLVCPVCAPTRASLMTGRYHYRTRAIDTYRGRAMMDTDEITLAEVLRDSGYQTGIFGKWHLGDNCPLRANDQGFAESIVHRGGGLCQPSDFPGNSYFDPVLSHNGTPEKYQGYCMDIYTREAMKFIEINKNTSFFVYLATNTPHTPLQIGEDDVAPYKAKGLEEKTAQVYGMVSNIDDNFGRLLNKLDELDLAGNTIVIFMTDNGPQLTEGRYTANLRGAKGTVYDGGIRVPCFVRWPNRLNGNTSIDRIAAHIDIMPTLLTACDVHVPENLQFDGVNLMPLLLNDQVKWPDRTLYFQWHRGDVPQRYRCFAARSQKYKLVQAHNQWHEGDIPAHEFKFELFDMAHDPFEQHDLASEQPDIVEKMKKDYEDWFENVSASRGFDPPKIYLGTEYENPTTLTRQDWRGAKLGWLNDEDVGYWDVQVIHRGSYDMTLRFSEVLTATGTIYFRLGDVQISQPAAIGERDYTFTNIKLEPGAGQLQGWAEITGKKLGVRYVDVERVE